MDHFLITSFGVLRYSETTYFCSLCVLDVDMALPFFAGAFFLRGGVVVHPSANVCRVICFVAGELRWAISEQHRLRLKVTAKQRLFYFLLGPLTSQERPCSNLKRHIRFFFVLHRRSRWHLALLFYQRITFFVNSLQPVTLGSVFIMYYHDFCALGIGFI